MKAGKMILVGYIFTRCGYTEAAGLRFRMYWDWQQRYRSDLVLMVNGLWECYTFSSAVI